MDIQRRFICFFLKEGSLCLQFNCGTNSGECLIIDLPPSPPYTPRSSHMWFLERDVHPVLSWGCALNLTVRIPLAYSCIYSHQRGIPHIATNTVICLCIQYHFFYYQSVLILTVTWACAPPTFHCSQSIFQQPSPFATLKLETIHPKGCHYKDWSNNDWVTFWGGGGHRVLDI